MQTKLYHSPSTEIVYVEPMEILCSSGAEGGYTASFTDFNELGTLDLN